MVPGGRTARGWLLAAAVALGLGPPDAAGGDPPSAPSAPPVLLEGRVTSRGRPLDALVEVHARPGSDLVTFLRPGPRLATVLLRPRPPDGAPVATTRSVDGRFQVLVPASMSMLDVVARRGDLEGRTVATAFLPGARERVEVRIEDRSRVLRGRVRYADGRPFLGTVHVFGSDGRPEPPGESIDAEGRFEVPNAPWAGFSLVCLRPDVFAVSFRIEPGFAVRDAELVVPASVGPVEGRVVAAESGAPVAGATLVAEDLGDASIAARVSAGEDGRFAAARWPREGTVHVRAPGRVTRRVVAFTGGDLPLEPEAVLVGRVAREGGAPVAGCAVAVSREPPASDGQDLEAGVTDADGRFRFGGLPRGSVRVQAEARGMRCVAPAPSARAEGWEYLLVPLEPGRTAEVAVTLAPGARVRGRVLASNGTPARGAVVEAAPDGPRFQGYDPSRRFERSAATDAEGVFEVGHLAPGRAYRFVARAFDQLDAAWSEPVTPGSAGSEEVVLRFPPSRGVRASVRRRDRADPVVGVQVFGRGGSSPHRAWAYTDHEGNAWVAPLPLGDVVLSVLRAEGYRVPVERAVGPRQDSASIPLEWAPERPANDVPAASPRAAVRRLRVTGPDGRPVPHARGTLERRGGQGPEPVGVFDGSATVPRLAEEATVTVWGAQDGDGTPLPLGIARVLVPAGADDLEVRLPPEVPVAGRVRREDGGDVSGLRVHAAFREDERDAREPPRTDLRVATAVTDATGTFRLHGVSPADVVVWVEAPPECLDAESVAAAAAPEAELVLRRPIEVEVQVVDARGAPFPGAHLALRRRGERTWVGQGTSDAAGRFRFTRVDPRARPHLRVTARDAVGVARLEVDAWDPSDTRLVLRRILSIVGRVLDEGGAPVRGASVAASSRESDRTVHAATSAEGRFTLADLVEGEFEVEAWTGTALGACDPVTAAAGEADLVLTLPRTGDAVVQVRDCPERAEARVARAAPGRTFVETVVATPNGEFRLRGLRFDRDVTFFLRADPERGVPAAWIEGLHASMEALRRPAPSGAITGKVTLGAGWERLASVVASRGPFTVEGRLAADGEHYAIDGLPDGEWTVTATAEGADARRRTATARAVPGALVDLAIDGD